MIVRGPRPSDNFAQISNAALADQRLSFRARGVLAYLLSRPVGWTATSDGLSKQAKEGRDAVRTALNELLDAGYLIRVKRHDERGQWVTDVHVTDSPATENQASANQSSADQALSTKKETQEELPTTSSSTGVDGAIQVRPDVSHLEFEQFWVTYPRKVGKQAAKRAYLQARRRGIMHTTILDAAQRYRDDPNREQQFTAHPTTWLNHGRWDDDPLPARRSQRTSANDAVAQTLALAGRLGQQSITGAGPWGQIGARS